MRPAELEGVLAHELAHVRSRDVLVQTSAVLLAVVLVEMSRLGGWLERALLAVLGPIAAAFVHLLLSPKRELAADRVAAGICGSAKGSPTPCCASTTPATSSRSRRARRPSRSTPSIRSPRRGWPRCSSPTRRSSAGSRRYAGSPGRRDHIVTSRRSPRCSSQERRTPSRVKPLFSATRSDATLPGNVPSCIRGSSSSSNRPRADELHRPRDVAAAAKGRRGPVAELTDLAVQPQRDRRGELADARSTTASGAAPSAQAVLQRASQARASSSEYGDGTVVQRTISGSLQAATIAGMSSSIHGRSSNELVLQWRVRRAKLHEIPILGRKWKEGRSRGPPEVIRRRPTLPGACAPSTIGAVGLNFSVRNGKRCTPDAMTAEIVESRCRARQHPQNSIATPLSVLNQDLGQLVPVS